MISGSEDQLMEFEKLVENMSQIFAARSGDAKPLMQDSQMLSIRFREYIQRNLSEDEMQEVMDNYKHDVMRKLVSAQVLMEEPETQEAYGAFVRQIATNPLPSNRTETVKTIIKNIYDESTLKEYFGHTYLPIMRSFGAALGKKLTDKQIAQMQKKFIQNLRKSNYNLMLFMTRDFDDDQLDELRSISASSASDHETKVVFGAISYAMTEALHNLVDRVLKAKTRHHTMPKPKDLNRSKSPKESI